MSENDTVVILGGCEKMSPRCITFEPDAQRVKIEVLDEEGTAINRIYFSANQFNQLISMFVPGIDADDEPEDPEPECVALVLYVEDDCADTEPGIIDLPEPECVAEARAALAEILAEQLTRSMPCA